MKTFDWILISGLLAATATAAPTEATPTDATAQPTASGSMDVVIATARRSAASADAAENADTPVLQFDIGMPSKSELLARAREAAQEAIENLEITIEKPVDRL